MDLVSPPFFMLPIFFPALHLWMLEILCKVWWLVAAQVEFVETAAPDLTMLCSLCLGGRELRWFLRRDQFSLQHVRVDGLRPFTPPEEQH